MIEPLSDIAIVGLSKQFLLNSLPLWLALSAFGSRSLFASTFLLQTIDLAHQLNFSRCELRQMPDEQDQLPVLFIFTVPPRHAGKANTVFDDVEDLTVRQILSRPLAHVRGGRVETGIDLGVSAPVVGMANRTVIGEVIPRFRYS